MTILSSIIAKYISLPGLRPVLLYYTSLAELTYLLTYR